MKRLVLVLLALMIAAGGAGLIQVARSHTALGRVYTVAQVRAGLARNPQAWVGRTVLVRGTMVVVAFSCPDVGRFRCTPIQWDEIDPDVPGPHPLILSPAPTNPLLALVHRLPLVGPLMPWPWPLREGPGVYRVQLRAPSHCPFPSANPSCTSALLLDARP
jgi:hypothetical protein